MHQLRSETSRWEDSQAFGQFVRLANARIGGVNGAEYEQARSEVVLYHAPLVRSLACRFANRGEPLEDLIQVGMVALIKAIDRFDPGRGVSFATYAVPTILGEIKRYFRDKAWAMKVPRRLKELYLSVITATEELAVQRGHSPTTRDLAEYLRTSEEEILEAVESQRAYRAVSLDAAIAGEDVNDRRFAEYVGAWDVRLLQFEDFSNVRQAFGALNTKERTVVYWRFYDSLPQAEIARRLNVSQMHVSRVQQKALEKMRKVIRAELVSTG